MYSVLLKTHIYRGNSGRKIDLFIKDAQEAKNLAVVKFREELRDRSLFIEAGGGGGVLGAKQEEIQLILLITFDDFRETPTPNVFIFQANLSGLPSESIQSFQRSPLWVLSYDRLTPPPLSFSKNQVINPLPPPQKKFLRPSVECSSANFKLN